MKAKLVALVAAPLMGISSLTFAAPQEPVMLSQAEMDSVTAAGGGGGSSLLWIGFVNVPIQANVLAVGNNNQTF
jgi:hypothetical protein